MSMTQRELYGSWVQQIHTAQAQRAGAKTQKEAARWAERARTMAECARSLRAVAGLDLPEPHEIAPRRDDEAQWDYEVRIGLRTVSFAEMFSEVTKRWLPNASRPAATPAAESPAILEGLLAQDVPAAPAESPDVLEGVLHGHHEPEVL